MVQLSVLESVSCLSEIIDLMCEEIRDHHKRVASGAFQLCQAMGITGSARRDIVVAAALHDIDGLSLEARKCAALHFEDTNSHAEKGYKLLSVFEPFADIADYVRYHHAKWNYGNGRRQDGNPLKLGSQIIFMADRIAVCLTPGIHTLNQAQPVIQMIEENEGTLYMPQLVAAFRQLAAKDAFWLNIMSPNYYDEVIHQLKDHDILLVDAYMDEMLLLLSNIVDFRSVFTTVHSRGVAAIAQELARLMGKPPEYCKMIRVAALLHDIGKLAIPTEIIEKPASLSTYERDIIRTHSYYTDKVISRISNFETIRIWASNHHENLNGNGYPFGVSQEDIPLGARIMKVADVFAALTEDRPYRAGMPVEQALAIIDSMVAVKEMDGDIVAVLKTHLDEIDRLRRTAKAAAEKQYQTFIEA